MVASFVCRRWRKLFLSRGLLRFHFASPSSVLMRHLEPLSPDAVPLSPVEATAPAATEDEAAAEMEPGSGKGPADDCLPQLLKESFAAFLFKLRDESSALTSLSFTSHRLPPAALLPPASPSSSSSSSSSPSPLAGLLTTDNLWVRDPLLQACFGSGVGFRSLTELDLTNCRFVSARCLSFLPRSLLRLNLRGCRNIAKPVDHDDHDDEGSNSDGGDDDEPSAAGRPVLPPLVDDEVRRPGLVILDFSSSPFETTATAQRQQAARPAWSGLPNGLEVLSFDNCWRLHDQMLGSGQLPTSLRRLCLSSCKSLSPAGIAQLSVLTNLEVLDVSQCTRAVTDDVLAEILPALGRLQALNLSQCKEVSARGLQRLPPTLTTLDLVFCKKLRDSVLELLPPTLQRLSLAYCFFFKNRGDVSLVFPPDLRHLNLAGCELLSDGALRDIAVAVPHLRHLNLAECYRISDAALEYLRGCAELETLDISYCSAITDHGVLNLRRDGVRELLRSGARRARRSI